MSLNIDPRKAIGKKAIPKNWNAQKTTLCSNGFEEEWHSQTPLEITNAKVENLGRSCEETVLVQFNNKSTWFILYHYNAVKDD